MQMICSLKEARNKAKQDLVEFIISSTSLMDYFRPRGKIVCIGNSLQSELEIVKNILDKNKDNRLPVLLLSSSNEFNELADQIVIFN